jgi:4'-phosphopantetheinyl transferase EntD
MLDPIVVFACKEAAYKAWAALGGEIVDHHDVVVALGDERGFVAAFRHGDRFSGYWSECEGRVLSLVAVVRD